MLKTVVGEADRGAKQFVLVLNSGYDKDGMADIVDESALAG